MIGTTLIALAIGFAAGFITKIKLDEKKKNETTNEVIDQNSR